MVSYNVPPLSQFLTPSVSFVAPFNVILGTYSFAAATQEVELLTMVPNMVYLISELSVAADLPEADYTGSIVTVPQFSLVRAGDRQNVYCRPFTVPLFSDARPATAFVMSHQGGDRILVNAAGVLTQLPSMVGRASVTLVLAFTIYGITEREYTRAFLNTGSTVPVR